MRTSTNPPASAHFDYQGIISRVDTKESVASNNHQLLSKEKGASAVERVVQAIENRRAERVVITNDVQIALLEDCRAIAIENGYEVKSKIHLSDLLDYRERVREDYKRLKKQPYYNVLSYIGFRFQSEQLVRVLDRATSLVESQGADDRSFHYTDFNAYYTRVESRWPWMRNGVIVALLWIAMFYILTPVVFCHFLEDSGVCPGGTEKKEWIGSLYFASASLSTVGYGDLTIDLDNPQDVGAGIVYMIAANMTLIGSFSYVADAGWNPFSKIQEKLVNKVMGKATHDEPLYVKLRRLRILRDTELIGGFIILNLIGIIANRLFLLTTDEELSTEWTWAVTTYWAVQTTTTIGYGDLDQPANQRWFQIFYLIFSTYFVGQALGGLSSLKEDLEKVRREYAWERRGVTKNLIDEIKSQDHGKINQYEFVVASLVLLGKISSEDVIPIMDKFRSQSGDSGFIVHSLDTTTTDNPDQEIQKAIEEQTQKIPFTNQHIRTPYFLRQRWASDKWRRQRYGRESVAVISTDVPPLGHTPAPLADEMPPSEAPQVVASGVNEASASTPYEQTDTASTAREKTGANAAVTPLTRRATTNTTAHNSSNLVGEMDSESVPPSTAPQVVGSGVNNASTIASQEQTDTASTARGKTDANASVAPLNKPTTTTTTHNSSNLGEMDSESEPPAPSFRALE